MGTSQATLLRTWVLGRRWVILIWKGDDPRVDGLEGENVKREVLPGLPWIASGEHRLPHLRRHVLDVNFICSGLATCRRSPYGIDLIAFTKYTEPLTHFC